MESKDCTEKSLIASEASHDYILSGQKLINKTEKCWPRVSNDKNDIECQKWQQNDNKSQSKMPTKEL